MKFFNSDWCGLSWTNWQPFSNSTTFKQLPSTPGLYRVRAVGIKELFYIGETGRNLKERLGDLRRNTMQAKMPYNDPHTAAPSLWAWRDAENLDFECSAAPITLTDEPEEARKRREGFEFYLLWQYRLEFGSSTRCNHGRFHPRYCKSTDRKNGKRGYRLAKDDPDNLAGGPSYPPLKLEALPHESNWMSLRWQTPDYLTSRGLQEIPKSPGIYKIFDPTTSDLLYVGETSNLKDRLTTHSKKNWHCQQPFFSFVELPKNTPTYQRHEIENDLLGGYYAQSQSMPKFQLVNHGSQVKKVI